MEREQLPNQDFITELTTGERPLVDRWVASCLPIFRKREQLVGELTSGSVGMEVPDFLVPVMRRWAEDGPVILCSYGHPEEFEMYKFMGNLNLAIFIEQMKRTGVLISPDQVMENWYETVALHRTVTTPLRFGDTFPMGNKFPIKHDLFGLGGFKSGLQACEFSEQATALEEIDTKATAQAICDRLSGEIESELVTLNLTRDKRKIKREAIRNLLFSRLATVLGMAQSSLGKVRSEGGQTVDDFLIDLEQRFAGHILDADPRFGVSERISELTGIRSTLFSRNTRYLSLVHDTLDMLVSARGPSILKKMVSSIGDGLFAGSVDGKDLILTVDKERDRFIVTNKDSFETEEEVQDDQLMSFVLRNRFLPLAKAETLAIIAGGMTFHMGSEYSSRPKVLAALGIDQVQFPDLFIYLSGLRIGEDLEQGNNLFVLNGNQAIPAVLAFVLFGGEFLRAKMLEKAGVEFQPESLAEKEFKKLIARSLVESIKGRSVPDTNRYGGFLWS